MEVSTEKSGEKSLEIVAEKKPISVYSVNFTQIVDDAEREFLMERTRSQKPEKTDERSSLSKKIFHWRNAIGIVAILMVGILHFSFQMSFIELEKGEKRRVAEVAPVRIEPPSAPVSAPSDETKPVEFEATKTNAPLPPKPAVKSRQAEILPVRPEPKKKEAVETRAERLRRAEKILTGI